MTTVAVLDYGSGNLRSAVRAVERAGESRGVEVQLTSDAKVAEHADGLLVPGVGAFEACMRGLREVDGERIIERRLIAGRPVLGICVGMQILFAEGIEHGVRSTGCGEWPGTVEKLQAPIVPHMGWDTVEPPADSAMFAGIEDERFYFVHSYGVREWQLDAEGTAFKAPGVTWTQYGGDRFVAAVEHGPLWATQFHPEKSGDAGRRLLENWIATL
ncbi:imidazole glycerol phosphate synthase subunit HisH [Aeromicrobium duanguangcaii]|uniref:Imidazole glycerol phosphate synthase subunit HisH n=1 Tax=Aeromicrobium duanguangcaii TaxID=2968086 RepID=A0ABY5KIQ1_9ACTN|nr:imidazole glycerol phosphate synthase subunit HisH [Aeromicrobium duanguangcaii]MCD9153232.1 imidazole glycerol phosphate synthase subunit HisH [Aeromicrobium duanguangcaii]MCL3836775.1 imidazole glycerol phosphate synthase subunit HisH [Aeromicrobium duanguangcaii]UUI69669.1 imidazole glycerol phosphate synthase subunit HisH [Aeromicrobium duanguangcaii]